MYQHYWLKFKILVKSVQNLVNPFSYDTAWCIR